MSFNIFIHFSPCLIKYNFVAVNLSNRAKCTWGKRSLKFHVHHYISPQEQVYVQNDKNKNNENRCDSKQCISLELMYGVLGFPQTKLVRIDKERQLCITLIISAIEDDCCT